jgi:hypothetical protein
MPEKAKLRTRAIGAAEVVDRGVSRAVAEDSF